MTQHTPGPWFYSSGSVWTHPNGSDDYGAQCIAMRASVATIPPVEKDANLRLIAQAPAMLAFIRKYAGLRRGDPSAILRVHARAILRAVEGETK